jgi:hypothetical protein
MPHCNIGSELKVIEALSVGEARERYEALTGKGLPRGLSRKFVVRALAGVIQARAFSGLKKRQAMRLAMIALGGTDQSGSGGGTVKLVPGTRLIREWQGQVHQVDVTGEGFRWKGETYKSLSAIARQITGTRWNGPLFFGFRDKMKGIAS